LDYVVQLPLNCNGGYAPTKGGWRPFFFVS